MEQDVKKALTDLEKMVDDMQEAVSKAEDIFGNFDDKYLLDNAGKQLMETEKLPKKERRKLAIDYAKKKFPQQIKAIEEFCLGMEGLSYIMQEKVDKLEDISSKAEEVRDLKDDIEREMGDL